MKAIKMLEEELAEYERMVVRLKSAIKALKGESPPAGGATADVPPALAAPAVPTVTISSSAAGQGGMAAVEMKDDLRNVKQATAIRRVLESAGKPMTKAEICKAINDRGGQIKTPDHLGPVLTRYEDFVSTGKGYWDLKR